MPFAMPRSLFIEGGRCKRIVLSRTSTSSSSPGVSSSSSQIPFGIMIWYLRVSLTFILVVSIAILTLMDSHITPVMPKKSQAAEEFVEFVGGVEVGLKLAGSEALAKVVKAACEKVERRGEHLLIGEHDVAPGGV